MNHTAKPTAVCVYVFSYLIGFHLPKKAKYLFLGVDSSRPMVKRIKRETSVVSYMTRHAYNADLTGPD